jgi:hypothetical protein
MNTVNCFHRNSGLPRAVGREKEALLHDRKLLMIVQSAFCLVLLLLYSLPGEVFAASALPQKVVITPASFSDREGILIVAQNQGFFRKHNVDAQLVLMPNAPVALSALTAGE